MQAPVLRSARVLVIWPGCGVACSNAVQLYLEFCRPQILTAPPPCCPAQVVNLSPPHFATLLSCLEAGARGAAGPPAAAATAAGAAARNGPGSGGGTPAAAGGAFDGVVVQSALEGIAGERGCGGPGGKAQSAGHPLRILKMECSKATLVIKRFTVPPHWRHAWGLEGVRCPGPCVLVIGDTALFLTWPTHATRCLTGFAGLAKYHQQSLSCGGRGFGAHCAPAAAGGGPLTHYLVQLLMHIVLMGGWALEGRCQDI